MKNTKSIDGIKRLKNPKYTGTSLKQPGAVRVAGLVKRRVKTTIVIQKPVFAPRFEASKKDFLRQLFRQKKVPIMAAVTAFIIAFGGGMWAVLATSHSNADDQPQVLGAYTDYPSIQNQNQPEGTAVAGDQLQNQAGANADNNALFNMTMGQLENYFSQLAESNKQVAYEQLLAERKVKLKAYLEEKNSPLADIVDTIAELKNWNIVLAVSNSESSLGKHCYNNNCSGIGVAPDNSLWRNYSSKREWAIDLDNLIEKRYKDWTLEQMNGVYNKPGSQNWVLAATQILEQLQERGIE